MAFGLAIFGRINYIMTKASFSELNQITYTPKEVKFEDKILLPQKLSWNRLFNPPELVDIKELVEKNQVTICQRGI